jgi:hypothetical protein
MASNASQISSANEENTQKYWYNIIWLDKNMNTHSNKIRLKQLREIDPEIKSFICRNECIDYIRQENDKETISQIILIISGSLSEKVIPKIHDYTCIFAIFIFCANIDNYKNLEYQKLRAICTETDELMDSIEICIAKYNNTTDFSVFLSQHSVSSGKYTELSIILMNIFLNFI